MIERVIAKRYARALLAVALDKSKETVDRYQEQLQKFHDLCLVNASLLETIANVNFDKSARKKIVEQVAGKQDCDLEVINFLKLLIKKGRMGLFLEIFSEYQVLANQIMNRCEMKIVSATDLPSAQYESLISIFEKKVNQKMILKKSVEKELLGGVRVHIGDTIYDYTVKNQLEQMRQKLLS